MQVSLVQLSAGSWLNVMHTCVWILKFIKCTKYKLTYEKIIFLQISNMLNITY